MNRILIFIILFSLSITASFGSDIRNHETEDNSSMSDFLSDLVKERVITAEERDEISAAVKKQQREQQLNEIFSIPLKQQQTVYLNIKFPNPYGAKLPSKDAVLNLQKKYGFSDQYADFLITQNGLDLNNDINDQYTLPPAIDNPEEKYCADLRYLYDFNAGSEYTDLVDANNESFFEPYFFIIGSDYSGGAYAEILIGTQKGTIIVLDHELYFGHQTLPEFLESMNYSPAQTEALSQQQVIDLLLSPDFGFAAIVASSFSDFINDSLVYDGYKGGVLCNN